MSGTLKTVLQPGLLKTMPEKAHLTKPVTLNLETFIPEVKIADGDGGLV